MGRISGNSQKYADRRLQIREHTAHHRHDVAALSLGWYLKDEDDRTYNLDVLAGLKTNEALVPFLWTYEVANGLVMAHRRKRLAESDIATPPMLNATKTA